jgi:NADPH:quinone reductase-like Zn-dependent oxidoreductase
VSATYPLAEAAAALGSLAARTATGKVVLVV